MLRASLLTRTFLNGKFLNGKSLSQTLQLLPTCGFLLEHCLVLGSIPNADLITIFTRTLDVFILMFPNVHFYLVFLLKCQLF